MSKRRNNNGSADDDDDSSTICGIGSFRPRWLQRWANPKVYLVLYCLLGIVEGSYFTYTIGVLSSLEKRFAFDSKISGIFLIADNISGFFISIVVGFYGNGVHRPRLLAAGMLVVAFSSFLSAVPYLIYGPGLHLLSRPLLVADAANSSRSESSKVCDGLVDDGCDAAGSSATVPAVVILFLANFLNGCGYSAYYTVGSAHLDDNIQKKNSATYFSTVMSLRLFGPSLGYLLASFSLSIYEDPSYDPGITTRDPRWIGAWWIGFLIIGTLLFVLTIPMFLFPKRFATKAHHQTDSKNIAKLEASGIPRFKDLPSALMKLARNPVYVFHVVGITFHAIGYLGYFLLMPRYIEAHFRQSASSASLFSGSTSIIAMAAGILLSGILIRRFKPRPRWLTGYNVGIGSFSLLALITVMFLACPTLNINGTTSDNKLSLINECNADCGCSTRVFQPSCGPDGITTYFSPCHAGCSGTETSTNVTVFTDCKCTKMLEEKENGGVVDLISGFCPFECNHFLSYIIILSVNKLISSTGRVAGALVTFRCVEPSQKNLAIGTMNTLLAAFAFIPYPLAFGALADSTCLVFEEKCGRTGNCWIYDLDKFRYYLHGACFILILTGTFFDVLVFLYSDRIRNFYQNDDNDGTALGEQEIRLKTKDTNLQPPPPPDDDGATSDDDVLYERKQPLFH